MQTDGTGWVFCLCVLSMFHDQIVPRFRLLRQHLMGIVFQHLGFRQVGQRLLDHRVPVGPRAQALRFANLGDENLRS